MFSNSGNLVCKALLQAHCSESAEMNPSRYPVQSEYCVLAEGSIESILSINAPALLSHPSSRRCCHHNRPCKAAMASNFITSLNLCIQFLDTTEGEFICLMHSRAAADGRLPKLAKTRKVQLESVL